MKKIMVLFILVMVNQILLAQSSTLIFEINGRRTPAEEDYIKRAVQDLYESEKANIRNQILANLGSDIENPVVTLPDEILVIWSEGDYLTPVRLDIYFDEDIVIDADWEGCTVRATLGGVGATLAMGINHSSGQYDYRLVTNDIYIYTLEVDIDAWADYWYQFWNHLICPAAGEFVDGILSFAANIYINFFNLTSLYLNNMPLLIDPVDHFLAFNYDLIQDDEVANNYLLEAFPVELDADVEGNDLIISVDILQGTTDNPNLFTGIEPTLNPSPEYELSGFSFLYHQLQGAFNWIGDEWTEDDRVNAAFDFMDKEILGYDFASYRVEAPWRKLQNEFITGAGLNHEDITEEDILWYMDPVNGYWSIEEVDNLRAILENGYSRGFIPFMAIAVGHFDHLPKVNEINAAICSDGYSPPGGCNCNCISEDEFLYNLKLHSRAIIREFADLISTWQLENELNAAGIAYLEGWWRKGDMWIDDDFTDKVMNILIESVNIEDPSAKKLTPFHVFDLANCLVRWGENLDIIGVNAYPNHFTALPNMGFVVGDIVWSVKRALTALGWEEKPVWLTETGYPAIEENDSANELTLEEDLYYFSESRQEQYIHDSFVAALLSGADRYYYFSLVWPEDSSATDNEDNKTIQYSGLIRKDETNPFVFEPKMALSTFSDDVIAHYPGISDVTLNISTTENADAKISIKGHVDKRDSGAQIPVIQGETYISRVEQEFIVEEKHHDWNQELNSINMEKQFNTETDMNLYAYYIPTLPITFITNGFDIQFKDEWFVENGDEENPLTWVQPNEFRSLSEQVDGNNQINVFLNQNLLFNDTDPIYSLRAPLLINEGSGIYQVFDHWVAMDNNGVELSPVGIFEYDENRQTRVVFTDDVASVKANYYSVTANDDNISFTNNNNHLGLNAPAILENTDGSYQVFNKWVIESGICEIQNITDPTAIISSIDSNVVLNIEYYQDITVNSGNLRYEHDTNRLFVDFTKYQFFNGNMLSVISDVYEDDCVEFIIDDNLFLFYSDANHDEFIYFFSEININCDDAHIEGIYNQIDINESASIEYEVNPVYINGGSTINNIQGGLELIADNFIIGDNLERVEINMTGNNFLYLDGEVSINNTIGTNVMVKDISSISNSSFESSIFDMISNNAAVHLNYSTFSNSNTVISANRNNSELTINGCIFYNISDGIIKYDGNHPYNNTISVSLINNTIVNCGSLIEASQFHSTDINISVINTIVDFYDGLIIGDDHYSEYYVDIDYSNLFGGNTIIEDYCAENDCNHNQFSNPLFVDAPNDDYHLQPSSPCIDTGDPDSSLDPDGTRADKGAYYNDYPPVVPENFSVSGNVGEHPTLHWSHPHPDIDFFQIWRKLTETPSNYEPIATVPGNESSWVDPGVVIAANPGKPPMLNPNACYRVHAVDLVGQPSGMTSPRCKPYVPQRLAQEQLPQRYALHRNYPNPFNPTTTIRYDLPNASYVSLVIYDILGKEVQTLLDNREEAGFKSVVWDGKDDAGNAVSTGIYIYVLKAWSLESEKTFRDVSKVVLLR